MFSLSLFGGVILQSDAGPLTGRAAQRHRLALLALLNSAGARGMSRDKLIALLWPDLPPDRARAQLSDSLYRINTALGGDVIVPIGDDLRLNADRLTTDVATFEQACARDDPAAAVSVYHGPFLDGFFLPDGDEFDRWADAERERLRRAYVAALEQLAVRAEAAGDFKASAEWWRTLATSDPLSTRVALQLVRVLDRIGERSAALQHARVHEALLREELDVQPSQEFVSAVEALRTAPASVPPAPALPTPLQVRAPERVVVAQAEWTDRQERFPSRTARRAIIAVACVVALGGISAAVMRVYSRASSRRELPVRIAVLPFADRSPGGEHQFFSDGLTDELITTLSHVPGLHVTPRTSAFVFRNPSVDVKEIARRLGVTSVLEGSVRLGADGMRITASLVDARNGFELWSDEYDRPLTDALAVQEEIARAIVEELRGTLLPRDAAAVAPVAVDPETYNLYLKGRYHWHRRGPRDLEIAIAHFEQATQRSPSYSRGWAGLADAYAISGFYDYIPPSTAFPKALAAAEQALAIDARTAAAYNTLGYVELYYRWDFKRAEKHFLLAIQLDSSYSTAHQWYGNLLTAAGRFPEAVREMEKAKLLDPLSLIASTAHGWTLYFARRYPEANHQLLRGIELDSTFHLAHLWRGMVLEEMGQLDEMQASLERGARLAGRSANHMTAVARGHALRGERDQAQAIVNALARGDHGYVPAYDLAKVELALGRRDRALDLLERAVQERAHSIAFVHVDPQLDPLREEPRFRELLRAVKQ